MTDMQQKITDAQLNESHLIENQLTQATRRLTARLDLDPAKVCEQYRQFILCNNDDKIDDTVLHTAQHKLQSSKMKEQSSLLWSLLTVPVVFFATAYICSEKLDARPFAIGLACGLFTSMPLKHMTDSTVNIYKIDQTLKTLDTYDQSL